MIKGSLSFLIAKKFTKAFVVFTLFVFLLQNAGAAPFNDRNSIHSNDEDDNNLNKKVQRNPLVFSRSEKKKAVGGKEDVSKKSPEELKFNNIGDSKANSEKKAVLNDPKAYGEAGKIFEGRHEEDKKKIQENITTSRVNKPPQVNQGLLNKKPKHENDLAKKIVSSKTAPKHTNFPIKPVGKLIPAPPLKKVNLVTSTDPQEDSFKSNKVKVGKVLKRAQIDKSGPKGKEDSNIEAEVKDTDRITALRIQENLDSNETVINFYGATEIISPVKYTGGLRGLENANHLVGLSRTGRKTDQTDSGKSIKMGTMGSFGDISSSGSKEIASSQKPDEPLFFDISKERFDLILKAFFFGLIGVAFLFVRFKNSSRRNHISRFKRKGNNS